MDDSRFQQLMIDVGMPDSTSLFVALKQVANEVAQEIKTGEALERLAALEHEQWAHWTGYMLDNLTPENINRWRGQIKTPYADLTEKEKVSDRGWARKAMDLM